MDAEIEKRGGSGMSSVYASLVSAFRDWIAFLGQGLGRPLIAETGKGSDTGEPEASIDPAFQGWLRSDPMVTGNPASRYGDDSPGRLTSNGLGSLEIGAADD